MNTVGTHTIRANTILPARRRDIELHTADGLRLVGELALPEDRDPVATLVTLRTNHSPSLWDSRRSTPPMALLRSSSVLS